MGMGVRRQRRPRNVGAGVIARAVSREILRPELLDTPHTRP